MRRLCFVLFSVSTLCVVAPAAALAVGDSAPPLQVGEWVRPGPVNLLNWSGKNPKPFFLIEFWATWCEPCRAMMPHITELQNRYAGAGLVVIGVSNEHPSAIHRFIQSLGDRVGYALVTDTIHRGANERVVIKVEGELLDMTADAITLDLSRLVHTRTRLEEPMDYPIEWHREEHAWSDTVPNLATYPLRSVMQVEAEPKLKGTGTAITMLSLLGLLVYAPLKAMSFRTGTFDGEKYLQVATPCAIGVGVGLVVMPFTEPRQRLTVRVGATVQ